MFDLKDGQVHYPKGASAHTHRRVIGVIGDRVIYCFGGDKNRSCKIKTFLRWSDVGKNDAPEERKFIAEVFPGDKK